MKGLALWAILLYATAHKTTDTLPCKSECANFNRTLVSHVQNNDTKRSSQLFCFPPLQTTTSTTTTTTSSPVQPTTATSPPTSSPSTSLKVDTTSTQPPTTTTVNAPSSATEQLSSTSGNSTTNPSTITILKSETTSETTLPILDTTTETTTRPTNGPLSTVGSTSQSPAPISILTGETVTSSIPSTSSTETLETSTQIYTDSTMDQKSTTTTTATVPTVGYTTQTPTLAPTAYWTNKPIKPPVATVTTSTPQTTSTPKAAIESITKLLISTSSVILLTSSTPTPIATQIPVTSLATEPSTTAMSSGATNIPRTSFATPMDITTHKPITQTASTINVVTESLTIPFNWSPWATQLTRFPTVPTASTMAPSTQTTLTTTKALETSFEKSAFSSSTLAKSIQIPMTVTTQTPETSTTGLSSTINPSTTYVTPETHPTVIKGFGKTTPITKKSSSDSEISTRSTIRQASTKTVKHFTITLEDIITPTVKTSSPSSTPTTVTTIAKNTQKNTEIKIPTSTNSEMPTNQITNAPTKPISTVPVLASTSQMTTDPSKKVHSTLSTDKSSIDIDSGTTASYTSTNTVDEMKSTATATLEDTTSWIGALELTTTKSEEVITTKESQTSEGSTTLRPTTDLPTEATTPLSSEAPNVTYGTTEDVLEATSISTELITQEITTTEVVVSMESLSTRPPWCDYACPYGYIEAERGCFIMVPEEFRQNFMSAFMWCRSEDRRDLSDQNDIMTSNMIETLKYMLRLNGIRSDIIYLNGHADELMRKDKKAGLIHLEEISIWNNLPTDYVGISTDIVNVTGICRMPKFCETPVCDLNAIYKMLPEKVEEVENKTITQGSGIRLKCLYPSRDYLNVRCIEPGELMPSPTRLACTIPADVKYEPPEKNVTGNMRVRETCSDCYEDGTANCTSEGEGYVCNCKEGWNKFTCYKSIDLCPPQYCGPNGNCITQLEDFFCNCTTGWIGDKCDVNIKKITWGGNKTIRIISSNTIASGLLGISSGIQISLKVLSKVITDKDPEDPQEAYQAFRSTCLTMGNLAIALFQHPDLLSSEPISCRWFFFFVHICYSLAFVFMLDEVLNVCTTIHGLHRNNWVHDNKMKKRWWLDIPIPATWTCFGVFKRETSNIWYPLVLFNFVSIVLCFGFAENARKTLSHRIQFWTANMHLVDVTNPYIRESIEKVRRNVPYCFLLPPFMFLNWLFLCWAADQQTDTVKFVSLLFSGCYTVLSMLQTLETSTGIYEYVVYYGHLYVPNCISNRILQDLTPMTWLSKNEIVARKKKTPFNGLDASSPYHPASKCYITLEHEHLMLKRMTREYLDHRVTHYSKQHEATLSVYFNELRLRHVYEKNVPLEDLHLELILEKWITDTKRIDQLTIPKKAKKQKETWRTRIREKNRIPPKENTNIRRMRFLKSIMDYHLKTLNPTLEYPVTGAMQRTDFRTFSPACPCVLRSQVEFLQRTWLPIIDIYIEQDWSLREVYKEVQEAEGHKPRGPRYECKKEDVEEDHWLNELRPGFIGPRSYPLVYLPALGTYLELDYYQRFADLEWARLVKHSEYLGACYDFGR